jgi:hypothetical protein
MGEALKNRQALTLNGSYCVAWHDYSEVGGSEKFRYILIEAGTGQHNSNCIGPSRRERAQDDKA